MQRDSAQRTLFIAVSLCLVCSIFVSSLAVGLRGIQEDKREAFRQQSILTAAGLWKDGGNAAALYEEFITAVVVDLEVNAPTTRYAPGDKSLNLSEVERKPDLHDVLEPAIDIAGLKKREKYATVYEVREAGKLKTLILPVRGKGLWSTLFGFVALDMSNSDAGADGITIAGLTYYRHGETPGLGGEVDNPLWKAKWTGKRVYAKDWDVLVEVSKSASSEFQVDALSGATLTSNGVTNMLQFWLGTHGFGPFIRKSIGDPAASVALLNH